MRTPRLKSDPTAKTVGIRSSDDSRPSEGGTQIMARVKFVGPPSHDVDKSWADLLADSYIWITPSEFMRLELDRSSITLANQAGYVIQLGVYHELHCLKRLYEWGNRDHYWARIVGKARDEMNSHVRKLLIQDWSYSISKI